MEYCDGSSLLTTALHSRLMFLDSRGRAKKKPDTEIRIRNKMVAGSMEAWTAGESRRRHESPGSPPLCRARVALRRLGGRRN